MKSAVRGSREVAREEEKARRGVRTEEGGDDERERDGEDGHEGATTSLEGLSECYCCPSGFGFFIIEERRYDSFQ